MKLSDFHISCVLLNVNKSRKICRNIVRSNHSDKSIFIFYTGLSLLVKCRNKLTKLPAFSLSLSLFFFQVYGITNSCENVGRYLAV